MEKPTWKDGVLKTPKLRIVIIKNHIRHRGEWRLSVRELGWDVVNMRLNSDTEEEKAQEVAVMMVLSELTAMVQDLKTVITR